MENLVQAVTEKIRNFPTQDVIQSQDSLTADEKEALREAERLADLYEDVQPEQFRIASGHLFTFPNDEYSHDFRHGGWR